jgi:putative DNA primase/helicase
VASLPFDPERVAEAAALRAREREQGPVQKVNGEDLTPPEIVPPEFADDELALRFSTRYAMVLRYVASWGCWMSWDGAVWRKDDTLRVYDLVRGTCRQASAEAGNPRLQSMLASGRTIAAVEKLARSDRRHAATAQQWDLDGWVLNTPRGIVDLLTGELGPHDPAAHMTKSAAVTPYGACPLWLKFLAEVTAHNKELQGYLQRVAGYALTGSIREQALFFAYGTGGNGKGTFLNTIQAIMGDYACVADPETFTASPTPRHLTELARLQGARLVVAQETEEGKQLAEARVKAITGGDPITANFMRRDPFTFLPQFKLFISGNHKPALRNVDAAIKRRFNMVPFDVRIAQPDVDLIDKLREEWPGILLWMIDGCLLWQAERLNPPAAVLDATQEYFEAEDAFATWMEQCCHVGPSERERSGVLFQSWDKWARAAGEQPGSQKRFSQALIARGFNVRKSDGYPTFRGLSVLRQKSFHETESDRD